jgi:hypothetical protein
MKQLASRPPASQPSTATSGVMVVVDRDVPAGVVVDGQGRRPEGTPIRVAMALGRASCSICCYHTS